MRVNAGDQLKEQLGMTGILTLAPDQGGIAELLCDMLECYCPHGRAYFEPIPRPMPKPIPDWIPTEEHFPRSLAAGGRRQPGNVRLAHRRCNGEDFGRGPGHVRKRERARAEQKKWWEDHPAETAANADAYAQAELRWQAMQTTTRVTGMESLTPHVMSFDGALLQRGFWLYVWRVHAGSETVLYVGRTGDSSSRYASSPFARVGQHLEISPRAKGNAMSRQLRAAGIEPTECTFDMIALGPVFPEQPDLEHHLPLRDEMAAQEAALAGLLLTRGYQVIGSHPTPRVYDRGLFTQVLTFVDSEFPERP
ncbi:MAG: hypothetical protein ACJ77A_01360 [Actinomycetota bacterium]